MKRICIAVAAVFLALDGVTLCSVLAQQQTSFTTEGEIHKPIRLPEEVVGLLLKHPDVSGTLEYDHLPLNKLPEDWYKASTVQFASVDKPSIIVVGQSPLAGAHAAYMWVYSRLGSKWTETLRANADRLTIQNHTTSGFRDIKTCYFTTSTIYCGIFKFSGRTYHLVRKTESKNGD